MNKLVVLFLVILSFTSCNSKEKAVATTENEVEQSETTEAVDTAGMALASNVCEVLFDAYKKEDPDVQDFVPSIVRTLNDYATANGLENVSNATSLTIILDNLIKYMCERAYTTADMMSAGHLEYVACDFKLDYCIYQLQTMWRDNPALVNALKAAGKARHHWLNDELRMVVMFVEGTGADGSGSFVGLGSVYANMCEVDPIVHLYTWLTERKAVQYSPMQVSSEIDQEYKTLLSAVVEMEGDDYLPSAKEKREVIRKAQQSWRVYSKAITKMKQQLPTEQQRTFEDRVGVEQRCHLVDLKMRHNYDIEVGLHSGEPKVPELKYGDAPEKILSYTYLRDDKWNLKNIM